MSTTAIERIEGDEEMKERTIYTCESCGEEYTESTDITKCPDCGKDQCECCHQPGFCRECVKIKISVPVTTFTVGIREVLKAEYPTIPDDTLDIEVARLVDDLNFVGNVYESYDNLDGIERYIKNNGG